MKRTISLILLFAMLSLASCGSGNAPDDTTAPSDTTPPETADSTIPADTSDFGGREFRVASTDGWKYMFADELNGNTINDALYERDRETESALGTKIVYRFVGSDIKELLPAVQSSIMPGGDDYDMIIAHNNWELTTYCAENLVLDWRKLPHVDFSKPYWNGSVIDTLSVLGASPYAVSDICASYTVFMLWNKRLAEDTGVGSLYDSVYDGSWTWDKLAKISADITSDINGDGKFDENDRYGVAVSISGSSWFLRVIPSSCDQWIYKNTPDGIELSVNNEKTQDILEKINKLFRGGGGFLANGVDNADPAAFNRGNYLTWLVSAENAAAAYNNLDFDYGVIPLPKYDEKQESYYSIGSSCILMTPSTADPDFTGMVSEWMSYYGWKLVRPQYYGSLLSKKFAQDSESVDMLDIIFNNTVFDPGMNFKSQNFYSYFDNMIIKDDTNFASFYSSALSSENEYIKALNDSFRKFNN